MVRAGAALYLLVRVYVRVYESTSLVVIGIGRYSVVYIYTIANSRPPIFHTYHRQAKTAAIESTNAIEIHLLELTTLSS
jgi:hypothetical protein